jgi:hypothetical protein
VRLGASASSSPPEPGSRTQAPTEYLASPILSAQLATQDPLVFCRWSLAGEKVLANLFRGLDVQVRKADQAEVLKTQEGRKIGEYSFVCSPGEWPVKRSCVVRLSIEDIFSERPGCPKPTALRRPGRVDSAGPRSRSDPPVPAAELATRSPIGTIEPSRAGVTQLAECLLPKQNVAGSNPVSRSTFHF